MPAWAACQQGVLFVSGEDRGTNGFGREESPVCGPPLRMPRPAVWMRGHGSLRRSQVAQIPKGWPEVQVILHADSGFCRDGLMSWCEANKVDYVFGFARNARLEALREPFLLPVHARRAATGQPARVFAAFGYQTASGTGSRSRRVVGKAEVPGDKVQGDKVLDDKENPRFVVTALTEPEWEARTL